MDDFRQLDIFDVEHDPLAVEPPVPHPGGVTWTQLVSGKDGQCAHCRLVRAACVRGKRPLSDIRPASWRRTDPLGAVIDLCEGHRRMHQAADQADKIT